MNTIATINCMNASRTYMTRVRKLKVADMENFANPLKALATSHTATNQITAAAV